MTLKLVVPQESLPPKRPEVVIKCNIETVITFNLSFDQIRPIIERYLKANYPEFRRKNLEIDINFDPDCITCHGYSRES